VGTLLSFQSAIVADSSENFEVSSIDTEDFVQNSIKVSCFIYDSDEILRDLKAVAFIAVSIFVLFFCVFVCVGELLSQVNRNDAFPAV
jgi:hypothetical protein